MFAKKNNKYEYTGTVYLYTDISVFSQCDFVTFYV